MKSSRTGHALMTLAVAAVVASLSLAIYFQWFAAKPAPVAALKAAGIRAGESAAAPRKKMTHREEFWYAAQASVRQKLENPDEAEFCDDNDVAAVIDDELGDAAVVKGWVLEKSYSGKRRRVYWSVLISREVAGWKPLMLVVGEKKYGMGAHATK